MILPYYMRLLCLCLATFFVVHALGWLAVRSMAAAVVRIAGTMTLEPEPDGARHHVALDVAVKIPLIGGKIADWAAKNDVRRTLDAEFAFNEHRLEEGAR